MNPEDVRGTAFLSVVGVGNKGVRASGATPPGLRADRRGPGRANHEMIRAKLIFAHFVVGGRSGCAFFRSTWLLLRGDKLRLRTALRPQNYGFVSHRYPNFCGKRREAGADAMK